jgi:hypothetical protein
MDAEALKKEHTPLILDRVACVSDAQFKAERLGLRFLSVHTTRKSLKEQCHSRGNC